MKTREVEIRIVRPPRRGVWLTRLAFRSTLTSALAIVAAYIVKTMALPALGKETEDAASAIPADWRWLLSLRDYLLFLPIPGLVLGVAAIALRPLRPLLAPLALVAAVLAVVAIAGSLVVTLAPLYRVSGEL